MVVCVLGMRVQGCIYVCMCSCSVNHHRGEAVCGSAVPAVEPLQVAELYTQFRASMAFTKNKPVVQGWFGVISLRPVNCAYLWHMCGAMCPMFSPCWGVGGTADCLGCMENLNCEWTATVSAALYKQTDNQELLNLDLLMAAMFLLLVAAVTKNYWAPGLSVRALPASLPR